MTNSTPRPTTSCAPARPLTFAVVAALVAVGLSGCLQGSPAVGEPCPVFRDASERLPYLREKWGRYANNSQENYDVVRLTVWALNVTTNDERAEQPAEYVDWNSYAASRRPAIFDDLLCISIWSIDNIPTLYPKFTIGAATSAEIATEAMDDLRNEHERQTGGWKDDCCIILYKNHFFRGGCLFYHQQNPDGTSSSSPPDACAADGSSEPSSTPRGATRPAGELRHSRIPLPI